MITGNLTIKPVAGRLTHDTETFGRMDPFAVIKYGNERFTTACCKNAGKTPAWSD
jgi:hypothetical protein